MKKKSKIKDTLDTVTSNIIGVTGMTIMRDTGTSPMTRTHIPTTMGLGLLAGTAKYAERQAKK